MLNTMQDDAAAIPNLTNSLLLLTVDELKWYARVLPGKPPTRKGELVTFVLQSLKDARQLQTLWESLTPLEQHVIGETVHRQHGRFDADVVTAKYPEARAPLHPNTAHVWSYDGLMSRREKREPTAYDLLFCGSSDHDRAIPPDLAELLRPMAPEPPPFVLEGQDGVPHLVALRHDIPPPDVLIAETEQAAFHDLAATLYLIQQGKISVSATTKQPTLSVVRLLRQRMLIGDYFADRDYTRADDAIRTFALCMLVQAAKWATPAATGGKLTLTKRGQAVLAQTPGAKDVRELWERWLGTDLLDELQRIKGIKGQQGKRTRLTKPAERRAMIGTALRGMPSQGWVLLTEFFRYLRAERLAPEVERTPYSNLHVGPSLEYGWLGQGDLDYWEIVIGSYVRVVIWEYAATLGLLDIAYVHPEDLPRESIYSYDLDVVEDLSRYDGLLALRLTNLGRYVFGLVDTYVPAESRAAEGPPVMKVLPTLDIVVTEPSLASFGDRALLERIGVAQGKEVYRLSRELVLEASESGLTLDQILDFLASKSGVATEELPQTVRVFFDDLRQRVGAVRDAGRFVMFEGDDPVVLTEIARLPELRSFARLASIDGAPVLLVPEDREAAVRKQIRKLGYLVTRK